MCTALCVYSSLLSHDLLSNLLLNIHLQNRLYSAGVPVATRTYSLVRPMITFYTLLFRNITHNYLSHRPHIMLICLLLLHAAVHSLTRLGQAHWAVMHSTCTCMHNWSEREHSCPSFCPFTHLRTSTRLLIYKSYISGCT